MKAEKEMAIIIEKGKLYTHRQTLNVTVPIHSLIIHKGFQYRIGDFIFKLGSMMLMNSTRGLIIELEYLPCSMANSGTEVMQEFLGAFSIAEDQINCYRLLTN